MRKTRRALGSAVNSPVTSKWIGATAINILKKDTRTREEVIEVLQDGVISMFIQQFCRQYFYRCADHEFQLEVRYFTLVLACFLRYCTASPCILCRFAEHCSTRTSPAVKP
jgi:hypothetical protein